MQALAPHRRTSVLREEFLSAFPADGSWTTKWDVSARLHCSEARFRELAQEFIATGLVERGPSGPHIPGWTYPYRLTPRARRGAAVLSLAIAAAERLLSDCYDGVGGYPGPIEQACLTCRARIGVRCFNLAQRRRGAPYLRARLDRPHQSRRVWRGHGNATPTSAPVVPAPSGPDHLHNPCGRCGAAPGESCRSLRTGGTQHVQTIHPQRRTRWETPTRTTEQGSTESNG